MGQNGTNNSIQCVIFSPLNEDPQYLTLVPTDLIFVQNATLECQISMT